MPNSTILAAAVAIQFIVLPSNASAEIGLSLEAGWSHNSALTVAELDQVSAQQDAGMMFNATLNGKWQTTDNTTVQGSYAYNSQNYQDAEQYNLAIHLAALDLSYSLPWFDLGVRHDAAFASLAGDGFLNFNQTSLYLSKLLNGNTFVRANTGFKNKTFTQAPQRDAENLGAGIDVFYFLNSGNTMLTAGINVGQETAVDTLFNFDEWKLNSKLSHDFLVLGKNTQLSLAWRFQKRDYAAPQSQAQDNPLIIDQQGLTRQDNQHIFQIQWQVNVIPRVALKAAVEYGDYDSNLEQQTYQQTVTSISLQATF